MNNSHRTLRRISLTLFLLLLLTAISYFAYETWNSSNAQQVTNEATAVASNVSPSDRQSQEGSDRNPLPKNALSGYAVAADSPRALYINKLGIAARILPMSINPDNSIQAPINIFDAGWYTGSVKPGEKGAILVDGHSTADGRALFGKLDTLIVGDKVELERGDGTKLTYKVVYKETVNKDAVDMKKLLQPYANGQRALNLITCSGAWNNAENTLTQRTLVYTEQI
jgi:LPXTG-site transpeptidase (sortase) family protein